MFSGAGALCRPPVRMGANGGGGNCGAAVIVVVTKLLVPRETSDSHGCLTVVPANPP